MCSTNCSFLELHLCNFVLELSILAFVRMHGKVSVHFLWVTQFHSLPLNAKIVQEFFLLHCRFCFSLCNHYLCILWAHFHSCFFDVVLIYDIICFHHIWREKFASLLKSVIWKVVLSKLDTNYLTNIACVRISFISATQLLECFAWRNQLLSLTREIWSAHNKNLSEIIGFDQTTSKQL